MPLPIQTQYRYQIRQSVGDKIGDMILGAVTAVPGGGADTTSLIDTNRLQKAGDDEYNGRQVCIYDATGSIVDGETSWVTDFDGTAKDCTVAPAFSANTTVGDKYEMWKAFEVDEVNRAINDAITEFSANCLKLKANEGIYTETSRYLYPLTSFKGLHTVEFCQNTDTYKTIHMCDAVWDEAVDADVTVSLEQTIQRQGTGCAKLVIAAGAGTGDVLATDSIDSLDISTCNQVEVWIYSTVALIATDLILVLDNTAACVSATESLAIPATSANTWTRHVISLANPLSDTAIISVGIKMGAHDPGACTVYVDQIQAVNSNSRRFSELNPRYWSIVRGTTNYLALTYDGLSCTGTNTNLRLTGYQLPSLFSDDATTASDIDPAYLIAAVTGTLLVSHAKSSQLEIEDRVGKSKYWLAKAEQMLPRIRTSMFPDTRIV